MVNHPNRSKSSLPAIYRVLQGIWNQRDQQWGYRPLEEFETLADARKAAQKLRDAAIEEVRIVALYEKGMRVPRAGED